MGIIPEILVSLLDARSSTKKLMEKEEDKFKKNILDGLQLAYKVTANSLYGQVGAPTSPIYYKELAASTTATGREMLEFSRDFIQGDFGKMINLCLEDKQQFYDFCMNCYKNIPDKPFVLRPNKKEDILENKKLPSTTDQNKNIKRMGQWLFSQKQNYKNNQSYMKDEKINKKWKEFVEKYKEYFLNNIETWNQNLEILHEYIIKHNKLPVYENTNEETKKIGEWLRHQRQNYKQKKNIMKNPDILNKWENLMNQYEELFLTNIELWDKKLLLLEEFIQTNNKLPTGKDKNLQLWISTQKENYKKNKKIMKDPEIRKKWEDFLEKYKEYFLTLEEIWIRNLHLVEKYFIENNKKPKQCDKNKDIQKLGSWINTQMKNYKKKKMIMKKSNIETMWKDFVEKYKEIFE
jgi:hypothetical protein